MRRLLLALLGASLPAAAADVPYVNWENHPIRAVDLSPDRRLLAVAHTADNRVQFFDVREDVPVPAGSVVVGVDPVAVRFRDDGELWVANHVSDSVSIVDVATRRVRATLSTADEPFDIAFAGGRAFVTCSQANRLLVFEAADPSAAPAVVPIAAEDPRALAVSPDGRTVYAAIFESGNASTILAGGLVDINAALPNVVSDPRGPYQGRNPPPNRGDQFDPPLDRTATPPRVGLIVRRDAAGRWRDDNTGDWTPFVSGSLAGASGRRPGWTLPDRDIAVVDVASLTVRYVSGLMNIGMALAVNPASGELALVGSEALNEIRFEPNLNGVFVRSHLGLANPAPNGSTRIVDLNPHLDYRNRRLPQAERDRSIGDPRAIVFAPDGRRAWVAGLGSNNVLALDAAGARAGAPIEVGEGPAGLAFDPARERLYVWNHFEASLSVIDTRAGAERSRTRAFNPLPAAIRAGRPFLYDTHRTSGLGQASCASCHVDARMDRLAWDLGDPSARPKRFDQNCLTTAVRACEDFHGMKGPMTTQTLQDIIGHEPHHWRGDRAGIEEFNGTFRALLGDDVSLTTMEMNVFEDFLATITFPPNPYRNLDNSLPTDLPLEGQFTSGRFAPAGQPLGSGDAVRGLDLYTRGLLDPPFQCSSCHSLPTGMAANGPLFLGAVPFPIGGRVVPTGPMGENHLGIVSTDGSSNVSMKVSHLRNQHEKVGFELSQLENAAGFGFLHDGSVDSIARFLSANVFQVRSDRDVADLVALMMAFSGSEFGNLAPPPGAPVPLSKDTHAAVGAQVTLTGAAPARAATMLALARDGVVDLVAWSAGTGHAYDRASDRFLAADGSPPRTIAALQALASAQSPLTLTVVPKGLGRRLGIDRDGDGVGDRLEIAQGSNPADAASTTLRARPGLWFNPARGGYGFDVQHAGDAMSVVWYTYEDDGSPTWYLAAGVRANPWRGEVRRYARDPATQMVSSQVVGEMRIAFDDAERGSLAWTLGQRSGVEAIVRTFAGSPRANPDRTGTWFDPRDTGWGLSIEAAGDVRAVGLYFYDAGGRPRWVLGVGANIATDTVSMLGYRGFCPDCPASTPTTAPAGTVSLVFDGARNATVSTDAFRPGEPSARWQRSGAAIVPATDAPMRIEDL